MTKVIGKSLKQNGLRKYPLQDLSRLMQQEVIQNSQSATQSNELVSKYRVVRVDCNTSSAPQEEEQELIDEFLET